MGRELGRISGPLLADNLLRNGANLAFDDKVLYLDVVNGRVGFNTLAPTVDLSVSTTVNTLNLIVTTQANFSDFTVTTNNIQHVTGAITLQPLQSSPNFVTPGLSTSNLYFSGNTLANTVTNSDTNISAVGTGQVKLNNNVLVNAALHATGNITFDGNITLGDSVNDRITFAAEVASDILPVATLNPLASPVKKILAQNSPLFIGIDDDALFFIGSKNTLITPLSLELLAEDAGGLFTESGLPLMTNPVAPYIGSSYLYNLGSASLQWGTVYANSVKVTNSLPTTNFNASILNAGNIKFSGTTISNNFPSDPIIFSTSGTGYVSFNGNKLITGSNISVPSSNSLNINSTGTGYVKFVGTAGIVTPVGTTTNRPASPQQGQMRYNTTSKIEEIYDASAGGWIPIYGSSSGNVTEADISDNSILYAIIFGR
jgi:hypothetical protein